MEYENLLCKWHGPSTLDAFAKAFFEAIGISSFEERESSNFVNGHYFRAREDAITFTIAGSDEEDNQDLPFWVHMTSDNIKGGDSLVSALERLIKTKLLPEALG